ncbi:hypothetical protein V6K52_03380 [Knoellia sp. S7-12]|uniref:hypothetical protein n=1 Tax=Knoellia sp. S7-12 TaxID=3126698 RepID=UPI003367387D
MTRPVGVDELLRAHRSLMVGDFRRHPPRPRRPALWDPAERVLPVVGAAGGTGASTFALALATAAGGRVVECATMTASGLVAAPTAELGRRDSGWLRGTRGTVVIERPTEILTALVDLQAPPTPEVIPPMTVVDVAWELGQVLATESWVADVLRQSSLVVVTATATIPGLRRLEAALGMLAPTPCVAAVLGPRRKKWARAVAHSVGARTTALIRSERLVELPIDARLSARGLDSAPLPDALLHAATYLLHLTQDVPPGRSP